MPAASQAAAEGGRPNCAKNANFKLKMPERNDAEGVKQTFNYCVGEVIWSCTRKLRDDHQAKVKTITDAQFGFDTPQSRCNRALNEVSATKTTLEKQEEVLAKISKELADVATHPGGPTRLSLEESRCD